MLNPLFLDELRARLEKAGDNPRVLLNRRKRMARIRVFDPACGSGNFLVIAPTGRFNSFKNERAFGVSVLTREAMKATAFESIEVFHNRRRLHSTLGYTAPVQYLKNWRNAQQAETQVA